MTTLTEVQQQSLDLVKTYYEVKGKRDLTAEVALFADDVTHTIPLNPSGDPSPWFAYKGKEEVTDYQRQVITNFSQLRMVDPQCTVSADGTTVFFEATGDYIATKEGKHYTNVYVFKFVIQDGKLKHITEYANPVTYALLMGMPIGKQ